MTSRAASYAAALLDTWSAVEGKERGDVLDRFVAVLRADRAEAFAGSIIANIERLAAERDRRRTIRAALARRPTSEERRVFERAGVTTFDETSAIIGGFRMKSEDRVVDASIQGGLAQIRRLLTV